MTDNVTKQIETAIASAGGNVRDALNIALAYNEQAKAEVEFHRQMEDDLRTHGITLAAESARLLALIREALTILDAGHEPGEYAEGVWANEIRKTLTEATNGDTNTAQAS